VIASEAIYDIPVPNPIAIGCMTRVMNMLTEGAGCGSRRPPWSPDAIQHEAAG